MEEKENKKGKAAAQGSSRGFNLKLKARDLFTALLACSLTPLMILFSFAHTRKGRKLKQAGAKKK